MLWFDDEEALGRLPEGALHVRAPVGSSSKPGATTSPLPASRTTSTASTAGSSSTAACAAITSRDTRSTPSSTAANYHTAAHGELRATFRPNHGAARSRVRHNAARVRRVVDFAQGRLRWARACSTSGRGSASFLARLQEHCFAGTALDPDPAAVEHARAVGVDAIEGDFMSAGSTGTFDLVTFNKVLEHVEDPVGMLARGRDRWLLGRLRLRRGARRRVGGGRRAATAKSSSSTTCTCSASRRSHCSPRAQASRSSGASGCASRARSTRSRRSCVTLRQGPPVRDAGRHGRKSRAGRAGARPRRTGTTVVAQSGRRFRLSTRSASRTSRCRSWASGFVGVDWGQGRGRRAHSAVERDRRSSWSSGSRTFGSRAPAFSRRRRTSPLRVDPRSQAVGPDGRRGARARRHDGRGVRARGGPGRVSLARGARRRRRRGAIRAGAA